MASRLAWFTSMSGRTTVCVLSGIGATSIFAAQYFPNTLLISNYRDFFTIRKLGSPVPVPDNLVQMVNKAMDDLNFDDFKRKLVKPFMVDGFEFWHAGTMVSKYGSLVGIPINATYTNVDSINKDQVMINSEPVNWNRTDAKNLLSSLILSDDAKKFAIARTILMTDNYHVLIQSFSGSLMFALCYLINTQINDSFKMFQQPRALRIITYGLIGAFCWGVWAMQKDAFTIYYEKDADNYLSQLGENYLKGGCEFYEKLLERNIALRTLLGGQGEKVFTPKGNQEFFLRQKHLPINFRLEFFKEKLAEHSNNLSKDITDDNLIKV